MAKKNQTPDPNVPQTPDPQPVEPPEKPVLKVGDIVTFIPLVGVVYENFNKGGGFRIQLADGSKMKGLLSQYIVPAPKNLEKQYLESAPDELKPEAIIAREAEDVHMTVEEFMAGVAGGHEPQPVKENIEEEGDGEDEGEDD